MGKTRLPGIIHDSKLEGRVRDPRQAEIVVPGFVDEPGRMERFTRLRQPAGTSRERPRNELVKIDDAVLIGILRIGLDPMDITADKHNILELLVKNRIDDQIGRAHV